MIPKKLSYRSVPDSNPDVGLKILNYELYLSLGTYRVWMLLYDQNTQLRTSPKD